MKMRDLCANKGEIKYKKEDRPKISHFLSPKESSYSWERRRREKKKKKRREEKRKRREEKKKSQKGMEF